MKYGKWIIFIVFAYCCSEALNYLRIGYDSTDNDTNGIRSGLLVKKDYGTGCEYLVTLLGGITPRVDGDGKQVGCKKSSE